VLKRFLKYLRAKVLTGTSIDDRYQGIFELTTTAQCVIDCEIFNSFYPKLSGVPMRSLFILVAFIFSTLAFASEDMPALKMKCSGSSMYLPFSVGILVDTQTGIKGNRDKIIHPEFMELKDGNIALQFSESECEDLTRFSFEEKAFADFVKGKTKRIYGSMTQSEPDLEMQIQVYCDRLG